MTNCGSSLTPFRRSSFVIRHSSFTERPLDSFTDPILQPLAITATERQTRAVFQEHDVLAVEPGLQLADLLDVDDVAAMDADERVGRQPLFDGVHRLPAPGPVG